MNFPSLEDAEKALQKYKQNEENNQHSLNFLLLSQTFQDESAIIAAKNNLENLKKKGYLEFGCPLYEQAYKACNKYYKHLLRITGKKV